MKRLILLLLIMALLCACAPAASPSPDNSQEPEVPPEPETIGFLMPNGSGGYELSFESAQLDPQAAVGRLTELGSLPKSSALNRVYVNVKGEKLGLEQSVNVPSENISGYELDMNGAFGAGLSFLDQEQENSAITCLVNTMLCLLKTDLPISITVGGEKLQTLSEDGAQMLQYIPCDGILPVCAYNEGRDLHYTKMQIKSEDIDILYAIAHECALLPQAYTEEEVITVLSAGEATDGGGGTPRVVTVTMPESYVLWLDALDEGVESAMVQCLANTLIAWHDADTVTFVNSEGQPLKSARAVYDTVYGA